MLEAMSGIGLVFGLLGGSAVYEGMGYQAVFYFFGFLLPVLAIISRILFKCIEQRADEDAEMGGDAF